LAEEPNEPKELNQTPSAEDYEALKVELEAEKAKSQELVTEATKVLTEKVTTLEADLATKAQELNELKKLNELNELNFEGAKAAYAYAVEDFRKLVLQTNPLFTPDIIGGDTIDAVKASVEKAGVLVSKVKEGLEAQAKALAGLTTVPAGAPARGQISTEGLSAKEKINLGLEQARKRKE
jgi:hypothetical protein